MAKKRKLGRTCVRTIPGDDTADVFKVCIHSVPQRDLHP
jgi:hypothetical protein